MAAKMKLELLYQGKHPGLKILVLLFGLCLCSSAAMAENYQEKPPLSASIFTQQPLTSATRRGNGSCFWGYRPLPYHGEEQCIQCPEDYRYGIVNGKETCYRCPYRYALGSYRKNDLCIFIDSPNTFSYKPF